MPTDYPFFKLWVREWLTGQGTTSMTPEQKGGFMDLLCHAWNAKPPCTLADDEAVFARLSGIGLPRWKKVGGLIRAQFVPAGEGRVMNPKQMEVYQEAANYSEQQSEAGRRGGRPKKEKTDPLAEPKPNETGDQSETEAGEKLPQSQSQSESDKYKKDFVAPPRTDDRAGNFLRRYPAIYARVRHGARYLVRPARDYMYACQIVEGWENDSRLDLMVELFLRMSAKEANNIPGTPGQFLHMAPECDSRLRENGR